jgi:hypothetical protein
VQLVVVYVAPIPVGHRVRCTWYEEVQRGLVPGQERTDERPHQPILSDLDTGIVYASDWVFGAGRRPRPDAPYAVGDTLLTDRRPVRQVEGVVTGCRVITVRGYPELEVQTHLAIEEDA